MKLTITFVEKIEEDRQTYYWFNLSTENETRQCCFTRGEFGDWEYNDGDDYPQMSSELLVLFDGYEGSKALHAAVANGEAELSL